MIYIDRSSVAIPSSLTSKKIDIEKGRLHEFYSQPTKKKQVRYNFRRFYANADVKDSLQALFHKKCAYCESILDETGFSGVDHFRPKSGAMNLDGTVHQNHYWWLAFEWDNLYASCAMCNSRKHTRFPVQGKRITPKQAVSQEFPWIIDPCNEMDFQEPHFYVDESGFMHGLTRRGEITIDIFSLNRAPLLAARKQLAENIRNILDAASLLTTDGKEIERYKSLMLNLLHVSSPYTSAAHYYFNTFSEASGKPKNAALFEQFIHDITLEANILHSMRASEIEAMTKSSAIEKQESSYSMGLESVAEKEAYFTSAKRIQKIEIVNFKIIKNLVLTFPKSKQQEEPWMVLLGENGAGKSSVLQAIALTMAGEDGANALGLNAARFVNRNVTSKEGYVRIHLEGMSDYLELKFNKESSQFTSNYDAPKVILLAFGSTRLMNPVEDHETNNNLRNLRNLFDPFATLPNVEEWVGDPSEVSVSQFDEIAIALKNVLQLPENKLIYRRKTSEGRYELFIKINKEKQGIKVRELSAGYQAVIVMTLNIIRELLSTWDNFHIAEGIVLIDEIGVHLHPKWKLQIISTLRETFPAMNFIITTHEPLCLRGINEGEVALMKLDENNQVIALVDLPSPRSLTIEQLITSKLFGLITSFDPTVEAELNSFYLLKSKLNPTETELAKLEELRANLEHFNIIDSESNLEVSNTAEQSVVKPSLDAGWVNNPQHQEDLKQRIKAIWDQKTF